MACNSSSVHQSREWVRKLISLLPVTDDAIVTNSDIYVEQKITTLQTNPVIKGLKSILVVILTNLLGKIDDVDNWDEPIMQKINHPYLGNQASLIAFLIHSRAILYLLQILGVPNVFHNVTTPTSLRINIALCIM